MLRNIIQHKKSNNCRLERLTQQADNVEKFEETQLPPTKAFDSTLRGSGISNSEYKHAQYVYNTFDRQPFKTTTFCI